MSRIRCALAIAAGALQPITAAAVPIPSPSLSQILLSPPSGYTELTSSTIHGSFGSEVYSWSWGSRSAEVKRTVEDDGFVRGYGMTWVNQLDKRALVELVIAFSGGLGARNWLSYAEAADKVDPTYQHADTLTGIDTYYGDHNVYPSHDVSDSFVFVKGNDYFVVGLESTQDDNLNLAITRARDQYDSAPGSTIPSGQWPENEKSAPSDAGASGAGGAIAEVLIGALMIGLIGGLVFLVRRPRRPPAVAAGPGWAAVRLSPDGRFWWDGQAWKDSTHEAPPFAQHSSDGLYWWDGSKWRPVPSVLGSQVR